MNGVDRARHVLQPHQASGTHPDRRRKQRDARPFEVDMDAEQDDGPETQSTEPTASRVIPSSGDEGVGEFVNIVV